MECPLAGRMHVTNRRLVSGFQRVSDDTPDPTFSLAGRVGFEPTGASFAHPNRLAGDPFRPLRHLPVYEHLGGEGGIRTPEAHRLAVFKTAAFNHSATSPHSTLSSTSNARA